MSKHKTGENSNSKVREEWRSESDGELVKNLLTAERIRTALDRMKDDSKVKEIIYRMAKEGRQEATKWYQKGDHWMWICVISGLLFPHHYF